MATATAALDATTTSRRLRPRWPFVALFAGLPVWWALGLIEFVWPIFTLAMLARLVVRGRVRVPRGFGIWLLFLFWMLASVMQVDTGGRLLGFYLRAIFYASGGILLLFVVNSSEEELPNRTVVNCLVGFWAFVVVGGYLGLLLPSGNFSTVVERLMPGSLLQNEFIRGLVHPRFAQVHDFFGYPVPRPAAPFQYTNTWGSAYALLTPMLVVGLLATLRRSRRPLLLAILAASVVPVVVSVNRGLWLSLGVGLVYGTIRLTLRGNTKAFRAALGVLALGAVVLAFSPLGNLVSTRFENQHSNRTRSNLYSETTDATLESPLLGYGAPRPSQNEFSPSVGTQGQFWTVLFSHGIPGAFFYTAFFVVALWQTRGATSTVGLWSHVVILVFLVQSPFYGAIPHALHITMAAAGLAYREADRLAKARASRAAALVAP